ncbi:alpha/beta fold hydrolase [Paenactinomyces guangxiensis]|uniref:AB hydrolase-1 domain-containing protein n=1 Tax=Paenactinomyces guangxiensis TaxID=1490290 RepID=A0A7W1WNI8_9BACL|nr:alpha/beta fold hydrolase [Paenactinomyces guangxiensis]MBA4492989.1 hypothetical protein [Paenactinomyces guangxiensis]MBH8590162.1 hypothetical protein [Paenactinomyces guangxiensis]
MEIPVQFDWKGSSLLGILHQVSHFHAPLIFFLHGIPGDRVDTRRLPVRMARILQKRGIASLRIDFYGSGVSDGCFYEVTLDQQLEQILFLIKEIRSRRMSGGPIVLLGFSAAAKTALAAAEYERDLAGVCLWNGIVAREQMEKKHVIRRLYRVNGQMVFNIGYGVWLNKDLLTESDKFTFSDERPFPDLPILGIYGKLDTLTLSSRGLLERKGCSVQLIPDADHLFTRSCWESALMSRTEEWLIQLFGMR